MPGDHLKDRPIPEGIDSVLIDETAIDQRVQELAERIEEKCGSDGLTIVCVLTGALMFAADLVRKLPFPVEIDCLRIGSYGDQSVAVSEPKFSAPLKNSVKGKSILIVDDILDTGHTLSSLISNLQKQTPSSIHSCVLLDKPARRQVDIEADFVGFTIPDAFVVGYGLDHAEKFRALPYIATLKTNQ